VTLVLLRDITERKRAERALNASEERYRRIIEDQTEFIVRWLPDGTRTFVNQSYCRYFGIEQQEAVGSSFFALISAEDRAAVLQRISLLTPENPVSTGEHAVVKPDGSTGWNRWTDRAFFDESGQLIEFQSVGRDITEFKLAEQALVRSEARLAKAERMAHLGNWSFETATRRIEWSEEMYRIFGLDPDTTEVNYESLTSWVYPDDRECHHTYFERMLAMQHGQTLENLEYRLVRPDGEIRWVDVLLETEFDTSGKPALFFGTVHDITERKQADVLLRKSEELHRVTLSQISDAVFITDDDGGFTYICPNVDRIFGYDQEEVRARGNIAHLLGDNFVVPENLATLEEIRNIEHKIKDKAGNDHFLLMNLKRVSIDGGTMLYTMRDVTDRKQAEEALKESEKRLSLIYNSSNEYMALFRVIGADNYVIESCNETFIRANQKTGIRITYDDLLGMNVDHFLQEVVKSGEEKISFIYSKYREAIKTAKPILYDEETRLDGITIYNETTLIPILSDAGKSTHLLWVSRDISDRKRAEAALITALNEVEQLKNRLQEENIYLRDEIKVEHRFGNIIGMSDSLKRTLRQVEQVAATDTNVLILGETGTGKEIIARSVHELSLRRERPLVKVNCAALPANLIESELFGHEKGAFTGAFSRRVGRFELANASSIFLDEIGDLPLELQVKLLRVLQEGEFERLGSHATIKVDVRVIAATNRNLEKSVRDGTFREDLFFRLNVFPIHLPPLRNRREDIPLLARHFIDRFNTKLGKQIDVLPTKVMNALQTYNWPGNVRELENIIERAMVISNGNKLELGDWFLRENGGTGPSHPRLTLEEMEKQYVLKTLDTTMWRVSGRGGAAEILGMKPTTLEARMKKLGIKRPR
jgi:PAS domain S-box-containing protein